MLFIKLPIFLTIFIAIYLILTITILRIWTRITIVVDQKLIQEFQNTNQHNVEQSNTNHHQQQSQNNLNELNHLLHKQIKPQNLKVCDNLFENLVSQKISNISLKTDDDIETISISIIIASFLNLSLFLNGFFWLRSSTLRNHFRILMSQILDLNLSYTAILFSFQSFISIKSSQSISTLFEPYSRIILNFFTNGPIPYERFLLAFLSTGLILDLVRDRYFPGPDSANQSDSSNVLKFFEKFFHFLNIVLFRKTRTIPRNRRIQAEHSNPDQLNSLIVESDQEIELEDTMENETLDNYVDLDQELDLLLIERLFGTVPNLWLHTELISNDYIDKLPVWNYKGFENEKRDSVDLVDHNQNLITDHSSSYCSSSSSDDECFSSNETGSNLNNQFFCDDDKNKESYQKLEEKDTSASASSASPSNSKKQFLENVLMPEIIITSTIRRKIERKKRNLARAKKHKKQQHLHHHQEQQQQQQDENFEKRNPNEQEGKVDDDVNILESYPEAPKWMIIQHECTVCLDQYEIEQKIMGLPCGHNYHQECICEWLWRGNHCCPICRWPSYRLRHPRQQYNGTNSNLDCS